MDSKNPKHILWQILFLCCLATLTTLEPTLAIPTTSSAVNTTVTQLNEPQIAEQNTTNDSTIDDLKSQNTRELQVSNGITDRNDSLISGSTPPLPSLDLDVNNKITGNSPVDQLTELSADQNNIPSLETKFGNNDIVSDVTQSTASDTASQLIISDKHSKHQNNLNDSTDDQSIKSNANQTIIITNNTMDFLQTQKPEIKTTVVPIMTPIEKPKQTSISEESHRRKRSFFGNSLALNSNLDELLNMKRQRQRRSSMRSKRNTNYEDLLASLLAAEEAKYNDNYDSFADKNSLNALAMNYILNTVNSGDSNKNIDLDKLSQYYYENLLPLIDSIEPESESGSDEESVNQELPIIVQPYTQSVIPVIPYTPNRYQRIRRSYYDKYRNPISVYTGLKRKRGHMRGEWGRIVGANSERAALEDEAQEANKIYSLATLLATSGNSPQDQTLRYKRSVKRSAKPKAFENM